MGWVELQLVVGRAWAEDGAALLVEEGAEGVQEDFLPGEAPPPRQPWDEGPPPPLPPLVLLKGWWPDESFDGVAERVSAASAAWEGARPPVVVPVIEEDWANAWKAHFRPLVISPRLRVAPPWEAQPGDLVIEPGMAFGTGEHPSTRACLAAVDAYATPGGRCLDVGCGSGVLALAAAHLGMGAIGIDNDPEAVRASAENAARNGLAVAFSETPVAEIPGRFELVVANLFAEVLVSMAPELRRLTAGHLVLAGILAERAPKVEAAFAGMRLVERQPAGEWVSLVYAPA
jgi:ribosomal protein L11 methyltransferase